MKKIIYCLMTLLCSFSAFSTAEAAVCRNKAQKAIEQAQLSGQPYAYGCSILPEPGTMQFQAKSTTDVGVIELTEYGFNIKEPGTYQFTIGGRILNQKLSKISVLGRLYVTFVEIASLRLPGVTTFVYNFLEPSEVVFELEKNKSKTAFVVIQKLPS